MGSRVLPWAGGVMILLVLTCGLLASSPRLHRLLHPDADSPDHKCVVTLFAQGQLSSNLATPVTAVFLFLFGGVFLLAETFVLSSTNYLFSSDRAPPILPV